MILKKDKLKIEAKINELQKTDMGLYLDIEFIRTGGNIKAFKHGKNDISYIKAMNALKQIIKEIEDD